MIKKLILLLVVMLVLCGCASEKVASDNVENENEVDNQYIEYDNIISEEASESKRDFESKHIPVAVYRVHKTFDQGGIITTVRDILIYPNENEMNSSIIQLNLLVRNNSDSDAYMLYDVSPIVLNTGEQKDYTDRCNIHRVFKSAVKEGELIYQISSSMESVETIRWIVAGPLHNYTNLDNEHEIIGSDFDFTFELSRYPKSMR